MSLDLVFWDWAGTLITDLNSCYSNINLIKNKNAYDVLMKKFCFIKPSWCLVEKLLELSIKQVIITNGTKKNILKYLHFNPFDAILTAEEYLEKPNIEMFEYASMKYNLNDKSRMIMIGDSLTDKIAADNFGIRFFKIDNHFNSIKKIFETFDLL